MDDLADLRTGVICSTFANVFRDENKKPNPFIPTDFFPGLGKNNQRSEFSEPQSLDEQLAIVEMLNAAYGGKDLRLEGG